MAQASADGSGLLDLANRQRPCHLPSFQPWSNAMTATTSLSTPLFFHGREGTNQGRKASWLAREYGACTPSYDTSSLEAALPRAREAVAEHQPSVIVGSSFGGAVLLSLIQEGLWTGPSIFLAQAGVKFGLPPVLPPGLSAILVHGTGDIIVPPDDSRRLAASGGAELVEIEDDHRLGTILGGGLLDSLLKSLGTSPLLPDQDLAGERRAEMLDWLDLVLGVDTDLEHRRELAARPPLLGRDLIPAATGALRGRWRDIRGVAELQARREITRMLLGTHPLQPYFRDFAPAPWNTADGMSINLLAPWGLRAVGRSDEGVLQGEIKTTFGTSLYEFHQELPIDGTGVPKDRIEVLEQGQSIPLFQWLKNQGTIVLCQRCGGLLSDRVEDRCPWRELREALGE